MSGSYFSHDSNARNDEKLIRLRMKHGATGYGAYFMILERLRDEANYMSIVDYNVIAFDLRVDTNLIKDIVENFGLFAFTENGEYFYSESFNKRMSLMDASKNKRSAAGKKGAEKRWGSNAIAKPLANDSNAIAKPTESDSNKTKQNKTNKTKQTNTLSPSEEFGVEIWTAYPSQNRQGNYQQAQEAYVQAVTTGETTKEKVLAKIAEYKDYLELNHIQAGYTKSAGNWFIGHMWQSSWDTKNPAHKPEKSADPNPAYQNTTDWGQGGKVEF